jgi:hypothetical protein
VRLCDAARNQAGLATRAQLRAAGVSPDRLRAEVDAERWQLLNEQVVCTHNGPLTRDQACWAAVLSAQGPAALCGLTALERLGVRGFETDEVHVVVTKSRRVLPAAGVSVVVHQSRRFGPADVLPRLPPLTGLERSTIDAAVWSPDLITAVRVTTAPVQQRLTTAGRLRQELLAAGRVQFRNVLLPFLADLDGGAQALSEVAFLRWCRQHGFPEPSLQVRLDGLGRRRYLDAAFLRRDGRRVLVEIDGGVHLTLRARWEDTAKDNDAVIAGETTLRFPSVAIYTDDPRAVSQLRRALRDMSGTCPPHRVS